MGASHYAFAELAQGHAISLFRAVNSYYVDARYFARNTTFGLTYIQAEITCMSLLPLGSHILRLSLGCALA